MLRVAVLLAGLMLASAKSASNATTTTKSASNAYDMGQCALDSAPAMDDMLEASTYVWAAVTRCQKQVKNTAGQLVDNDQKDNMLCAMDVSNAISSAIKMADVMFKAVAQCNGLEGLKHYHPQCALALGGIESSFAGLAAAEEGINARCAHKLHVAASSYLVNHIPGTSKAVEMAGKINRKTAQCLVDVKDTTRSLFQAIRRISSVEKDCRGSKNPLNVIGDHPTGACGQNAMAIMSSFAAIGEYFAALVGRCGTSLLSAKATAAEKKATEKLSDMAMCASHVEELFHHLDNIGWAGAALKNQCKFVKGIFGRHYEEDNVMAPAGNANLVLAAFLPVTAIMAFIGGRMYTERRGRTQQTRDLMSEVE